MERGRSIYVTPGGKKRSRSSTSASRSVVRRTSAKVRSFSAPGFSLVRNQRLNNVIMGNGFPRKLTFNHRYVQRQNMTGTGLVTYSWKCNGMFQPGSTVSHQPYYYDQISALYNQYCIIGSRIDLQFTFANPPTDAAGSTATPIIVPAMCCCYIDDNGTFTPSNVLFCAEQNESQNVILGPGSDSVKTITLNWSAKKYGGSGLISNPNWIGTAGANPTELFYYNVAVQALDLSTSISVQCVATISYTAVWTEPGDIANS